MPETVVDTTTDVPKPTVEDLEQQLAGARSEKLSLERALSKQGTELGETRRLVDQILLNQNKPKEETKIDFFADPEKAVGQVVAESPTLKQLKAEGELTRRQLAEAQLRSAHPDYAEIAAKPEFRSFVESDPVLQRVHQAAHDGYDFQAANFLLKSFKERQTAASTKAGEELRQRNEDALKTAKVDTGNAGVSDKKTYSRLDLMRLRVNDPEKYNSLNVQQLYAEGRVK